MWEAKYLPFGGVHTITAQSVDLINLRFPGQWFQSDSGLHQNWMRDYDPTTGRYLQADPLGLVDGPSVYGYALQNPGRYVDPRGLNGEAALEIAMKNVGSSRYDWVKMHPEAGGRMGRYFGGRFTNKCNMFVCDVLAAGGHPPGRDSNGTIPVATTWGDPNSRIGGYTPIPTNSVKPGDLISNGSHVGIVVPMGGSDLGTISASSSTQRVVWNSWGFRPGPVDDPTAAWRCTCDMAVGP